MEKINFQTGEITEEKGTLGQKEIIKSTRPNGKKRVQISFKNCVSLTDKTGAQEADLNYLVKKYSPSEFAAWMLMRQRPEINGHDFSKEPERMHAMNEEKRINDLYEKLAPEIKAQFSNPLQFLKFIDDKLNKEKLIKMGLITNKQVEDLEIKKRPATTITTQEAEEKQKALKEPSGD